MHHHLGGLYDEHFEASRQSPVASRQSPVASRQSLIIALASLLALGLSVQNSFAQSVTASVDLSTTTATTNDPNYGNTIEPTGGFVFTLANGGAATLDSIKTQLYRKNGAQWVKVGDERIGYTSGATWSTARYTQLGTGNFKVTVTMKYTQTIPVPGPPNPQVTASSKEYTF